MAERKKNNGTKESKRDEMRRRKEEAAVKIRATRIESGDLIVSKDFEFDASTSHTKSAGWVEALIEEVKSAKTPVPFVDACEKVGIKYPEDFVPAMTALEKVGLVRRFEARSMKNHSARPKAAFLYIG
ncbi:MAG: hypothetical protein WKF32_00790 [Thermoleophilaceae bacterium]